MRRAGASLVELLVATVMLGLCAGPVLAGITWMRYNAVATERRAVILLECQSRVAEMQASADSGTLAPLDRTDTVSVSGQISVSIRVRVTEISLNSKFFRVRVDTTWTEPALGTTAKARSLNLETRMYSQ